MERVAVGAILLVLGVAPAGSAIAQDQTCRPQVAQACYVVHGGLLAANGTPSFRIVVGDTQRVLGIVGGEEPPLPDVVRRALAPDMFSNKLAGDYIVCPQTDAGRSQMQMVCVKSATNLKIEPR